MSTPFHIFHLILNIPQKAWFFLGLSTSLVSKVMELPGTPKSSKALVHFYMKSRALRGGYSWIPHFKKTPIFLIVFQRAAPGEASICCEHHSLAHNVDWRVQRDPKGMNSGLPGSSRRFKKHVLGCGITIQQGNSMAQPTPHGARLGEQSQMRHSPVTSQVMRGPLSQGP